MAEARINASKVFRVNPQQDCVVTAIRFLASIKSIITDPD
jgi:hypothetical protein